MKSIFQITTSILFFLVITLGCKDDETNIVKPNSGPEPINFGTHDFGTMQDGEGNTYKTIVIGSATWMAQNLRASKSANGESLGLYTNAESWRALTSPSYFWYEGRQSDIDLYGFLYNGYAKDKVCPTGWHLPSNSEWLSLANALEGIAIAGGKMKEEGTAHWAIPNLSGTNSSGFTAMPGGSLYQGNLLDVSNDAYWWSSTPGRFYYTSGSRVELRTKNDAVNEYGLAIRCVKD